MTKIAFLMDPIESVAVKKDSTLAMIRAAQLRVLHQLGNHFSGAGVTSPTDKHGEGRKEWG